jgi:broad specificity phosphatase PhoE
MNSRKIFLVRHGESHGNIDKSTYSSVPDFAVQLTEKGKQQATEAGLSLQKIINGDSVHYYVSPYWRTRQTYLGIRKQISSSVQKYREDPRLREQEWADGAPLPDYTVKLTEDAIRDDVGHFYYRFGGGESCADVFDRVSDFFGTLHRDLAKPNAPHNTIIVSHGMTIRLFLMRWLHASVEEFQSWKNPQNCQIFTLSEQGNNGKFRLCDVLEMHPLKTKYFVPFGEDVKYFQHE